LYNFSLSVLFTVKVRTTGWKLNLQMDSSANSVSPPLLAYAISSLVPLAVNRYLLWHEGPENLAVPLARYLELFSSGDEATKLARVRKLICSHRLY
jgi:hypothetical protein